jgi:hypothetical protein
MSRKEVATSVQTPTAEPRPAQQRRQYCKPTVERVELYRNVTLFSANQNFFGG